MHHRVSMWIFIFKILIFIPYDNSYCLLFSLLLIKVNVLFIRINTMNNSTWCHNYNISGFSMSFSHYCHMILLRCLLLNEFSCDVKYVWKRILTKFSMNNSLVWIPFSSNQHVFNISLNFSTNWYIKGEWKKMWPYIFLHVQANKNSIYHHQENTTVFNMQYVLMWNMISFYHAYHVFSVGTSFPDFTFRNWCFLFNDFLIFIHSRSNASLSLIYSGIKANNIFNISNSRLQYNFE